MKPEIKAQWVAALRSGDYRQAKGNLEFDGGYCCLGVLCEIAPRDVFDFDEFTGDKDVGVIPTVVQWWSGFGDDIMMDRLADMNDGGMRFSEIADYIEVNL